MSNIFYNSDDGLKITRRNLPHWQQGEKVYFITYRLADSIPEEKLKELYKKQQSFIRKYERPYTHDQEKEYRYLFFGQIEKWLDNCYGECILKYQACGEIVKSCLEYYDEDKYLLDNWVVMPNHVHVIILAFEGVDLKEITHSWKSYTAHEINKATGRKGKLWQKESFDHMVRSRFYLNKYRSYIEKNWASSGRKALIGRKTFDDK